MCCIPRNRRGRIALKFRDGQQSTPLGHVDTRDQPVFLYKQCTLYSMCGSIPYYVVSLACIRRLTVSILYRCQSLLTLASIHHDIQAKKNWFHDASCWRIFASVTAGEKEGEGGRRRKRRRGRKKERERRKRRKEEGRRGGGPFSNPLSLLNMWCQIMCIVLCHHPLPLLLLSARNFVTPFSSSRICPSSTSGHRCLPCSHLLPHPHLHRFLYYYLSSSSPPHLCYLVLSISVSLEVSIPIHWVISDI